MWYLKIETDEEWRVAVGALAFTAADPGTKEETSRVAAELHDRLMATPESRHGGLVHVEDANYLPGGTARCTARVDDSTPECGTVECGLVLNSDGTCNGSVLHVVTTAAERRKAVAAERKARSDGMDAALNTLRAQGRLDPNWYQV